MAGNWTVVLQEVFLFACWNIHVVQLCQLAAGKDKTNKKLNPHCVANYAVKCWDSNPGHVGGRFMVPSPLQLVTTVTRA